MEDNKNMVSEIERIVKDNTFNITTIDGHTYATGNFKRVDSPIHSATTLSFNDMASIATMIESEATKYNLPLYISVDSFNKVSVYSAFDERKSRETPYIARCEKIKFDFTRTYAYEDFVIALRSLFVQNEDIAELISAVSKIKNSNEVSQEDDGITQKVKQSQGISLITEKVIQPIRKLRPYRTFIEVEQPESEFLFRINKDGNFALYEADGGAWVNSAREYIKAYFESALADLISEKKVSVVG